MLAEVKALSQDVNRAPLADDGARADQLTRALHKRAIVRMHDALAGVGGDERAQRRLAIQVGTPRAAEDIAILVQILENREVLADLARRLPNNVRVFEREVVEQAKAHIDAAVVSGSAGAQTRHRALRSRLVAGQALRAAIEAPERKPARARKTRHYGWGRTVL